MPSRRKCARSHWEPIRAACAPVLHQRRRALSAALFEPLESRRLLAAMFANDPAYPGNFVVTLSEDAAGTNDTLALRITSGQLQYQLNGAAFTNDLDSSTAGVQALSFSVISRIDVALGSGNDALTLDASGGNVIPALSGISYGGGTGTDSLFVAQDANYTLTNTALTLSPGGVVNLSAIERLTLDGGNSPNLMDASAFTAGSVTMDGQGQNDTLIGGGGDDELVGTQGSDVIDGRGGNDLLFSGNSGSTVFGGAGNDSLIGSNGKDFLFGEGGDDYLFGENGADVLQGADGNDTLEGDLGNDECFGGSGYDTVKAVGSVSFTLTDSLLTGLGTDPLSSIEAGDLTGGTNNNTLDASAFTGDTTLYGGGGNDTLIGAFGANTFFNNQGGTTIIIGGTGTNLSNLTPSVGFVSVTETGGLDELNFSTAQTGITIDLTKSDGTNQNVDGLGFTVSLNGTLENVTGSSSADNVLGNSADNLIYGGLGGDNIDSGAGNDIIFGGTAGGIADSDASDIIYGGMGADQVDGGAGNDIIFGGTASGATDTSSDIIFGGVGNDQIDGSDGNDIIFGGTAAGVGDIDNAAGGSNDIIYGGMGADQVDGGAGNDIIFGGTASGPSDNSSDIIFGGMGSDQIDGGGGNDIIFGGTASGVADGDSGAGGSNDIIFGGMGADQVDGGAGNDIIFGGTAGGIGDGDSSNDIIFGGMGADQVDGGGGNDIIFGGTGGGIADADPGSSDIIFGGMGADQVDGGTGNDIIFGGTGGVLNGTSDQDAGNDIIYGGLGGDQVDAGGGNDVIFGGTGTPDTDVSASDLIYGGVGNDLIGGGNGDDSMVGGAGNDTYLFIGTSLGSDVITEDANLGVDTLDFSGFGAAVTLDLALTSVQVVNSGNLSLSFSSNTSIENVVGSKFADTVLGNTRDNQLLGTDELDDRFSTPAAWNGITQVVFLDFDSHQSVLGASHVYTQAERDAIQSRLAADYSSFHLQFTQTQPGAGQYATLFFNKTPVVNGTPQPGGLADELDFRNLNLGGTAAIDINPFLGGLNEPAATSANFVAFSATVSGHELGHLLGLRHLDSAGPISYGIPIGLLPDEFLPAYPGPISAFETNLHLMSSPASVGASLFDAVGDVFFGAREAIKLAFNESGTAAAEQAGAHSTRATAQALNLLSLAVPNTVLSGLNYAKDFAVSASAVVGSVGLSGGVSEDDYYSFTGRAGDVINIQVMSSSLTRISNAIDSIVRLFDAAGNLVAYYTGTGVNDDAPEGLDSVLMDLVLPSDGTFYIQVDTFTDDAVPDNDTGDYELFIYRFDTGNATDGNDTLVGGAGANIMMGGAGNDMLTGGSDSDALIGGAGNDLLQGNLGRDLLIGGLGADNMNGGDGEDLLIAGYTGHDSDPLDVGLILAEWTSTRTYASRVANIRGVGTGPRANGNTFLIAAGTGRNVFDDGVVDVLAGGHGGTNNTDWFFYNFTGTGVMDSTDRTGTESRDDLLS